MVLINFVFPKSTLNKIMSIITGNSTYHNYHHDKYNNKILTKSECNKE